MLTLPNHKTAKGISQLGQREQKTSMKSAIDPPVYLSNNAFRSFSSTRIGWKSRDTEAVEAPTLAHRTATPDPTVQLSYTLVLYVGLVSRSFRIWLAIGRSAGCHVERREPLRDEESFA